MEQIKITVLIEHAEKQLAVLGYSEWGIQRFSRIWQRFQSYATQNEIEYYTESLMLAYMEEECQALSNAATTKLSSEKMQILNKLDEYYKYQMISAKRFNSIKMYTFEGEIGASVEQYIDFRKKSVSEARLKSIKLYLERFCQYVNLKDYAGEECLNAELIKGFIGSCSIYTESTVSGMVCCLRGYLSYLYSNGLTQSDLSAHLSNIRRRKDSEIPSTYSAEDVEKLLNSIDRNNSCGKRNYAMILIAARLGLRASDITGLMFSSIDWDRSKIHIIQKKTGHPACYPLSHDVGLAIIDYLRNGRNPKIEDPHIFLRETPPYTRLRASSLFCIVDKHMKNAGIHIPAGKKHGPHALRHSLSSRLLENDIPLSVISEILAHKSTETTKIYLKVAERQLLECALPVPPVLGGITHE